MYIPLVKKNLLFCRTEKALPRKAQLSDKQTAILLIF